jgi:hypothetical protein
MPSWLHRTNKDFLRSVAEADLPEPSANYIEEPDLSGVAGIPDKCWNIAGDVITEMSAPEKAAVDAAEYAALVSDNRAINIAEPDSNEFQGMRVRALIQLLNKRDNYLVNRIIELQNALIALQSSAGNAGSRLDSLPVSYSASATRQRSDAVQDYRDDINAGVND